MYFIKIRVKGYIENISQNNKNNIECFGIYKDNKITFNYENTKHVFEVLNNNIKLTRTNNNYSHQITFINNKIDNSEYYLKEHQLSIYIKILTQELKIEKNKYKIRYKVIDSEEEFIYYLEVSDIK